MRVFSALSATVLDLDLYLKHIINSVVDKTNITKHIQCLDLSSFHT